MKDETIVVIISFFITLFIGMGIDYLSEKVQCTAQAKALNYEYEYHYLTGCVVTKNGQKVLLKQLRSFE